MSPPERGRMVPLAVLLKRELSNEKIEDPEILTGVAVQTKKGEDFTFVNIDCQRWARNAVGTFSAFGLFDGHNGSAAAVYAKDNLLDNVLNAVPQNLSREEWLAALPRAMVAGFVKTDIDFQEKAQKSGTTATFVIVDGMVVTVGSVGDSSCILESAEGAVYSLSGDHRLEDNVEEVERIMASGGEVGRLNMVGGAEIGPLRCWPGGLCLSRSIGDMDVGEFIVPVPHVKQVKLSNAGGRLIIGSDGVWDALSFEAATACSSGLPADIAAAQIVKEAVQAKGVHDDITCIVVDILPPEKLPPVPAPKKQGKGVFKSMFRRKSCEPSSTHTATEPDLVEELFEDGSAALADRLDMEYPICNMFKLFMCAVCQVEFKPGEGTSVHAGSSQAGRLRPWDGPFLCHPCYVKKEAMEGRKAPNPSLNPNPNQNSAAGE
ncbi:protein phosphatase 2C family protein [Wolffia australiana]